MEEVNIVIIGGGMYVCGRNTAGYGTILPAIFEWNKYGRSTHLHIFTGGAQGLTQIRNKSFAAMKELGVKVPVDFYSLKNSGMHKLREILRKIPKPACAIIAVPDHLHSRFCAEAICAGVHTLVVKPLAPTLKEANKLLALQRQNSVYCAVEFHKRLDYANLMLKDVIRKGKIGEVLYFLVEYSQKKEIPAKIFKNWVAHTNIFQYLGIHYVDIIYFLTQAVPLRVSAIGQHGWLLRHGINAYDAVGAVIEWKLASGRRFTSHILTNWVDPATSSAASDQKIKVIGTLGRFESDQKQRGITITTEKNGIEEPNPYFCAAYGESGKKSYKGYGIESICQFLDDIVNIESGASHISELEKERPTFRQSVIPTKVIEAVNISLKYSGKWMQV